MLPTPLLFWDTFYFIFYVHCSPITWLSLYLNNSTPKSIPFFSFNHFSNEHPVNVSEGFRFPFEMSQSLDLIPITSNIKWFCFIQLDVNSKVFVLDINLLKIIPTNLNYLNSSMVQTREPFSGFALTSTFSHIHGHFYYFNCCCWGYTMDED